MRHHLTTVLFAGFLGAFVVHCSDEPISSPPYPYGDSDKSIQALSNGIAIHRWENDTLYYLSGNLKNPQFKTLFEPNEDERIAWFEVGPVPSNPQQLFVLTTPSNTRNTSQKPRLKRVTTDGKPPTVYNVGSLFDRVEFGLDGQLAVLYHSGEESEQEGFFNPNEVALVDLAQPPGSSNPQMLSPPLEGQKIEMVSFIPSIRVGGVERRVLVFLAGNVVSVHDLASPSGIWAKGPVVDAASAGSLMPEQVIPMDESPGCVDRSCEGRIFIRTSNTRDVYYMSLGTSPTDFKGSEMNQLEAGGTPRDMAVVADLGVTYLAVLADPVDSSGSRVSFINLATGAYFSIDLLDRASRMDHLLGEGLNKLVMYGNGTGAVHFLPLDNIEKRGGRNLDELTVPRGISEIVELEGDRLLVIPYASGGTSDLIIVNTVTEAAEIVSSSGNYDWTEAQIHEDVFYLVPDTNDRIDMLDLGTGHPSTLYLDDYANSLHLLKGSNTAIAYHNTETGRATIFSLAKPNRNNATIIDGFWLQGALNDMGE